MSSGNDFHWSGRGKVSVGADQDPRQELVRNIENDPENFVDRLDISQGIDGKVNLALDADDVTRLRVARDMMSSTPGMTRQQAAEAVSSDIESSERLHAILSSRPVTKNHPELAGHLNRYSKKAEYIEGEVLRVSSSDFSVLERNGQIRRFNLENADRNIRGSQKIKLFAIGYRSMILKQEHMGEPIVSEKAMSPSPIQLFLSLGLVVSLMFLALALISGNLLISALALVSIIAFVFLGYMVESRLVSSYRDRIYEHFASDLYLDHPFGPQQDSDVLVDLSEVELEWGKRLSTPHKIAQRRSGVVVSVQKNGVMINTEGGDVFVSLSFPNQVTQGEYVEAVVQDGVVVALKTSADVIVENKSMISERLKALPWVGVLAALILGFSLLTQFRFPEMAGFLVASVVVSAAIVSTMAAVAYLFNWNVDGTMNSIERYRKVFE